MHPDSPPPTNPFITDDERTPFNSNPNSAASSRPASANGGLNYFDQGHVSHAPQVPHGVRFGNSETVDAAGNRTAVGLQDEDVSGWNLLGDISRPSSPGLERHDFSAGPSRYPVNHIELDTAPAPILSIPPTAFAYRKPKVDEYIENSENNDKQMPLKERFGRSTNASGTYSAMSSARTSPILPYSNTNSSDIPLFSLRDPGQESPINTDHRILESDETQRHRRRTDTQEAHQLVRQHTQARGPLSFEQDSNQRVFESSDVGYKPLPNDSSDIPKKYRGGVLGNLLTLYGNKERQAINGHQQSASMSGMTSPRPQWYNKSASSSVNSLALNSSALMAPAAPGIAQSKRPTLKHRPYSAGLVDRLKRGKNLEEEIRVCDFYFYFLFLQMLYPRMWLITYQPDHRPHCRDTSSPALYTQDL